jgi:hypothetical protein
LRPRVWSRRAAEPQTVLPLRPGPARNGLTVWSGGEQDLSLVGR